MDENPEIVNLIKDLGLFITKDSVGAIRKRIETAKANHNKDDSPYVQ